MATLEQRFWAKVDKDGPIPEHAPHLGPCWIWTAATTRRGYGQISAMVDGKHKMRSAHRVAYELLMGQIPDGLSLDHLCRRPPCVNPLHLDPTTHHENVVVRGVTSATAVNARKIECPVGHEYTPENTGGDGQGGRVCIECRRTRQREWQRARRRREAA